ncbi:MAG: transposase [Acidobacteriota bacterium]|nr:transposase [Acidobacteriota bacterium]
MSVDLSAPEFASHDVARELLEAERWPDGPVCPCCGSRGAAYHLKPRPGARTHVRQGVWKCRVCRKQFTVTVGTILADSHIPLNKWLLAIHRMCADENGVSARELQQMLGIGYRAAWFLARRIRTGIRAEPLMLFREAVRDLLQAKPEKDASKTRKPKTGKPHQTQVSATKTVNS